MSALVAWLLARAETVAAAEQLRVGTVIRDGLFGIACGILLMVDAALLAAVVP
jgi:hypothetical protein